MLVVGKKWGGDRVAKGDSTMSLNKPSGNMYPWAYTTNPIGGKCLHACDYCYVGRLRKRLAKYSKEPYLEKKWFNLNLNVPKGFLVFVQSCGDLFGDWIPTEWIIRILQRLSNFPETTFLLQTKNPKGFHRFSIPKNCILGTTLESNRLYALTYAPAPYERFQEMKKLPKTQETMLSLEPIMDFDLTQFLAWISVLKPKFVSVGADSGKNGLFEPSSKKLKQFLWELEFFTEVRRKKNLSRLLEKDGEC